MFRLIAKLEVKGSNLVKGVRLEGLRVLGRPLEFAHRYSREGWELFYLDIVASLYGRNQIASLLEETAAHTHIPITVGGGIGSVADCERLFQAGADKIAVNTKALARPSLIEDISRHYGSQAISLLVEALRTDSGWEATTDCGRNRTGRDVRQWIDEAVDRGAGEIVLTSVDMEGTRKGFDLDLIAAIRVEVPVIAGGGCGSIEHIRQAREAGADGVAIASVLHYNLLTQEQIDDGLAESELQAEAPGEGGRSDT